MKSDEMSLRVVRRKERGAFEIITLYTTLHITSGLALPCANALSAVVFFFKANYFRERLKNLWKKACACICVL
jgi:hypothetical protein